MLFAPYVLPVCVCLYLCVFLCLTTATDGLRFATAAMSDPPRPQSAPSTSAVAARRRGVELEARQGAWVQPASLAMSAPGRYRIV